MKAIILLCLVSLVCGAKELLAAPTIELQVSLARNKKSLSMVLAPSESADGCSYDIFAAARRTVSIASSGVAQGNFTSDTIQLVASRLSSLRGQGTQRIFFLSRIVCGAESNQSAVVSLSLRRKELVGLRSLKRWLTQLNKKLVASNLTLETVFQGQTFEKPIDIQHSKDGSGRLFVAEQSGKIFVMDSANASTRSEFIDISDKIRDSGSEQGLLGLVFHPDYASNGFFYVNYTRAADGGTVISRFRANPPSSNQADASSEVPILSVEQPFANHNGGQLAFGADGFLYIALGDGGSGGDPQGNAQNRASKLGKILRINVDQTSGSINYSIPSSNPFANNTSGFAEEIFAYGLRNPWRISFDSITGELWAADVGQNEREEIDIIKSGRNYGWNITEGKICYESSTGCAKKGLIAPVFDYSHDLGVSITGGYVYRGQNISSLIGKYIYADFVSGRIWALIRDGSRFSSLQLFDTALNVSTFGVDSAGEHYLASYSDGKIMRINSQ